MNNKFLVLQVLAFVGLVAGLYLFVTTLTTVLDKPIESFAGNETYVLSVSEETEYHFMHTNYLESYRYIVTPITSYTLIEFPDEDKIVLRIMNDQTIEYHYLTGIGPNTTITILDYNVIGRVTLPPGDYEITVTDAIGTRSLTDTYAFQETGIVADIFTIIGGGFLAVVSFILFFVFRALNGRNLKNEQAFAAHTFDGADAYRQQDYDKGLPDEYKYNDADYDYEDEKPDNNKRRY